MKLEMTEVCNISTAKSL